MVESLAGDSAQPLKHVAVIMDGNNRWAKARGLPGHEGHHIAAGVAFGGTLIALGIVILNGVSGDFVSWRVDLTLFAIVNVMAFVFLPAIRFVMGKLVIPGHDLSKEIRDDQNLGAGMLEATVAISFAAILVQLI